MKRVTLLLTAICLSLLCFPSVEGKQRTKTHGDGPTPYHGPIIDMHLHAMPIDSFGPRRMGIARITQTHWYGTLARSFSTS
jgi:hypothetical protein